MDKQAVDHGLDYISDYREIVGRIFVAFREELGVKPSELAARINISKANLSKYENGLHRQPYAVVVAYAKGLGLSPANFPLAILRDDEAYWRMLARTNLGGKMTGQIEQMFDRFGPDLDVLTENDLLRVFSLLAEIIEWRVETRTDRDPNE